LEVEVERVSAYVQGHPRTRRGLDKIAGHRALDLLDHLVLLLPDILGREGGREGGRGGGREGKCG